MYFLNRRILKMQLFSYRRSLNIFFLTIKRKLHTPKNVRISSYRIKLSWTTRPIAWVNPLDPQDLLRPIFASFHPQPSVRAQGSLSGS